MSQAVGVSEDSMLERVVAKLSRVTDEERARALIRRARVDARLDSDSVLTRDEVGRVIAALTPLLAQSFAESDAETVQEELGALLALGEMAIRRTLPLADEHDARRARLTIRDLCLDAGADKMVSLRVATALAELSRNALAYAGGGEVVIEVQRPSSGRGRAGRVVLTVRDSGPGIADVETALSGALRSTTGMGRGLAATKKIADDFRIDTGPRGTTVSVTMRW